MAALAHLPGKQTYRFNANCKPVLRNSGGSNIYEGEISYRKKILWLLPVTVTLTHNKVYQPNNLLPYDELPGSVFNLSRGSLPGALKDITQNPSSFIPNISALDYGKGNINHSQSVYENVIYRNNNKIPFDAYFLEKKNREHISFSADNSTWLVNELDGKTHTATDLALFCTKGKKIIISAMKGKSFCLGTTYTLKTNFNAPRFEWSVPQEYVTNTSDKRQNHFTFTTNKFGLFSVTLRYGDVNFNRSNTIVELFSVERRQPRLKPGYRIGRDMYFIPIKRNGVRNIAIIHSPNRGDAEAYLRYYRGKFGIIVRQFSARPSLFRGYYYSECEKKIRIFYFRVPGRRYGYYSARANTDDHSNNKEPCTEGNYIAVERDYLTYKIKMTSCNKNNFFNEDMYYDNSKFETTVANRYGVIVLKTNKREFSLERFPKDFYFINITKNGKVIFRTKIFKK